MKKISKIAIIDPVNITDEARNEIRNLSESEISFPHIGKKYEVILNILQKLN